MYHKTFLAMLLVAPMWLSAQRLPTHQELDKALAYSLEYPDEYFVSERFTTTFTYQKMEERGKMSSVKSIEKSNLRLMALEHRSDYLHTEFFDDNSSVKKTQVSMNNGQVVPVTINEYAYRSNGIFHSDTRVAAFEVPFRYEGEVRQIVWEKHHRDLRYMTTVYFQDEFPIRNRKVIFKIPKYVDLEIREFNFEGYAITKKDVNNPNEYFRTITYQLRDLPAIIKESNSPGSAHLYPHLVLLHKSYSDKKETTKLFATTDDVYAWYSKLVDDKREYPEEIRDLTNEIVGDTQDPLEKTRKIYYWVQDNIRYLAFEAGLAGYQPESADEVCKNRYGDCKGMANLTKQMLAIAGIEAHLAWIGTNDRPYQYEMPSLVVDNHMICVANVGGKQYFLDPTEKYLPLGEIGARLQGKEIMIEVDPDNYRIEKVPTAKAFDNRIERQFDLQLQNGQLVGKGTAAYYGQERVDLLNRYHYAPMQLRGRNMKRELGEAAESLQLTEVQWPNYTDREAQLQFGFDFEMKHRVNTIGNRTFVRWDPLEEFRAYDLPEDRVNPLWFSNKQYRTTELTLALPANLELQSIPENLVYKTTDFELTVTYTRTEQQLKCVTKLVVYDGKLAPASFDEWNKAFRTLRQNAYRQPLVFTAK